MQQISIEICVYNTVARITYGIKFKKIPMSFLNLLLAG